MVSVKRFYLIQIMETNTFYLWFDDSETSVIAQGTLLSVNVVHFLLTSHIYESVLFECIHACGKNFKRIVTQNWGCSHY